MTRYNKAISFRKALQALNPQPTEEALGIAKALSQHLISSGRMYNLFAPAFDSLFTPTFDSLFDPDYSDESGCILEFDPSSIYLATLDESPTTVPIFKPFLCQQQIGRECMACTDSFFEFDIGDVETWKRTCAEFKGTWMWDILVFPTSAIQQCEGHEFEICRACTAEHIKGRLESGGPTVCENLTCPICRRVLSYNEVCTLADSETRAK